MGGKRHLRRLHKRATKVEKQLVNILHDVENLGIDNYSELRWLQDFLQEDIDIAVMRTRILISHTEEGIET